MLTVWPKIVLTLVQHHGQAKSLMNADLEHKIVVTLSRQTSRHCDQGKINGPVSPPMVVRTNQRFHEHARTDFDGKSYPASSIR